MIYHDVYVEVRIACGVVSLLLPLGLHTGCPDSLELEPNRWL